MRISRSSLPTVALTAFYYTETGAQYANTFFNDTITFVENTGPFDYQLFLMARARRQSLILCKYRAASLQDAVVIAS